MLDALEEQMRVYDGNQPPENKFFQTIRSIGDWLIEKTENSNGEFVVTRMLFRIWNSTHIYFALHVFVVAIGDSFLLCCDIRFELYLLLCHARCFGSLELMIRVWSMHQLFSGLNACDGSHLTR